MKTAAARLWTCFWCVLALGLVWPLCGARAETSRPSLRLEHAGGVVSLTGGGLLVWNPSGQVQAMHPDGTWGPVFRVTASAQREGSLRLIEAAGLNDRALLLAEYAARADRTVLRAAVFEVDSSGHVRQLPNVPPTGGFISMAVWDGHAWIEDLDGNIRELLSDGQPGQRLIAGSPTGGLDVAPPKLVGGAAHSPVFYVSPDSTKANAHSGYCYSHGPNKWRVADGCAVAPTICGEYLITVGIERSTVLVRALTDGRALSQWHGEPDPLIVCDEGDAVLIGGRTVAKLSLPDLTRRWTFRLKSGRPRALARPTKARQCGCPRVSLMPPLNAEGSEGLPVLALTVFASHEKRVAIALRQANT